MSRCRRTLIACLRCKCVSPHISPARELADLVQQRRNLDILGLDKQQDKFETKEILWNGLLRLEQQRISP